MMCQSPRTGSLPIGEGGGQGRNRTSDTRIFSAVLYQLSYLASVSFSGRAETREYNIGALIEAVPTR